MAKADVTASMRTVTNMRAYRLDAAQPGGIKCGEEQVPLPGPGQVLVRVRAASLNYRDLLVIGGQYPQPLKPALIPLSDGAGEIVEVGIGVKRVKPGDRIASTFFQKWNGGALTLEALGSTLGASLDGVLCEYALLSEEGVVLLPPQLSFEAASTLPCAALTAWSALTAGRPLRSGDTILVQGTGGVSLFALQFAKAAGARVIATTSSAAKAERLKTLGADEVIDYVAKPEWGGAVRELTAGRGVDRVIEVGGPSTLMQSLQCSSLNGRIELIGFVGGFAGAFDPMAMFGGNVGIQPATVGSREQFEAMLQAIAVNHIEPVIDRVFGFDDACGALAYSQDRGRFGKTVIKFA